MTANQFASYVAHALGDQRNYELRQRLVFNLMFYRAKLIRQDVERNKISPLLLQTLKVELESVSSVEDTVFTSEDKVLRSKDILPTPVRLKGNSPFYSVSSLDKNKKKVLFSHVDLEQLPYLELEKYAATLPRYAYREYLYCPTKTKFRKVEVVSPFANPFAVAKFNGTILTQDDEFPIPDDMADTIIDNILTKKYPLVSKKEIDFNTEINE